MSDGGHFGGSDAGAFSGHDSGYFGHDSYHGDASNFGHHHHFGMPAHTGGHHAHHHGAGLHMSGTGQGGLLGYIQSFFAHLLGLDHTAMHQQQAAAAAREASGHFSQAQTLQGTISTLSWKSAWSGIRETLFEDFRVTPALLMLSIFSGMILWLFVVDYLAHHEQKLNQAAGRASLPIAYAPQPVEMEGNAPGNAPGNASGNAPNHQVVTIAPAIPQQLIPSSASSSAVVNPQARSIAQSGVRTFYNVSESNGRIKTFVTR